MKKKYSVPALSKGMAIIEMLAGKKDALGITDIYEKTGLPKSSIFAILSELENLGYVAKTPEGKYSLTLKLYRIGLERLSQIDIRQAARPEMEGIAENLRGTVHLAILENGKALYIDKVNGPGFVQFSTHIGQSQMLHSSGVGKCLAAYMTDEQLAGAISKHGMPRFTERTVTSFPAFKASLAQVREQGYALEDEEGEAGIRCMAAPIRNHLGHTVGAIGITALKSELPDSAIPDVGRLLREKAFDISEKMGYYRPQGQPVAAVTNGETAAVGPAPTG